MPLGAARAVITTLLGAGGTSEFDFSTIGLSSNLDARAGITVTGLGVSSWVDQGAAGFNATQTNDAQRPANGGSVVGFNAVVFDRANSEAFNWGRSQTAAGTIIVVGQLGAASVTNNESILGSGASGSSGTPGVRIQSPTNGLIAVQLSDVTTRIGMNGTVTLGAGSNFIIGIRWDATTYSIRVNGAAVQNDTHSLGSLGTGGMAIGRVPTSAVSYCDVELTRILSASTKLSDVNFATAFTELDGIYPGIF